MRRRCAALLTAAALLLCLLPAPVTAAESDIIYFIAANDKLIPLVAVPMPFWVGNVLYLPVGTFDIKVSNANLGFYCSQSQTGGTVTLYNLQQMLVFDMNEGLSRNQHTGEIFPDQAVTRNGEIFLPLQAVCNFFGLEWSYSYTEYGILLRITSENHFLTDEQFIDAAKVNMKDDLEKYKQSLIQREPEPEPPAPPAPPVPPSTSSTTTTPVDPPPANMRFCLAFRCDQEEGLEDILSLLDGLGLRGLFLFEPERLAQRDDLVRRVLGAGHSIGLLAEGEDIGTTRAQLERGNQLLSHIARTAATAALVPADQAEAMEEEGWSCWRETVDAIPTAKDSASTYVSRIERAVGRQERIVYLTLDAGERTAQMLPGLLRWIEREEYTVLPALETRF